VTVEEEAEQKAAILDTSVSETIIEEAVPASRRRKAHAHPRGRRRLACGTRS